MSTHRWVVTALIVSALPLRSARADTADAIPGHTVERPVAGGIQATALAVGGLSYLIPARGGALWDHELLDLDLRVRDDFSRRASHLSDGLLVLSVLAPAAYLTGTTIDDADGDKLLLYSETMAINVGMASLVKHLVQRPRPYMYSKDPSVRAYAKGQGADAHMSFYSGHAAITFGAAMAGAYLLGASGENEQVRGIAFGAGFGIAAMTATLRVRAGKHFVSDVLVGAVVGTSIGYLVPALHADDGAFKPSANELTLAGVGIVAGVLTARFLPLESQRDTENPERGAFWQLTPTVANGSAGFGVVGGW